MNFLFLFPFFSSFLIPSLLCPATGQFGLLASFAAACRPPFTHKGEFAFYRDICVLYAALTYWLMVIAPTMSIALGCAMCFHCNGALHPMLLGYARTEARKKKARFIVCRTENIAFFFIFTREPRYDFRAHALNMTRVMLLPS